MKHLFTSLRRVRMRHSRLVRRFPAGVRTIRSVVGPAEQLAAAISSLIGLSGDAAAIHASRIIAAETDLVTDLGRRGRDGRPGSPAPSARRIDPEPLLALEEATTPYVLALPFTVEAVTLLEELAHRTQRILRVERTPLAEPILRAIAEPIPDRMELHSPGELIRHNLAQRLPAARRTTFVTFPDHHWTGEDTSRRVRFFDEDHWFALLESLLLLRGASPILTLAPDDRDGGGGPVWVEYSRTIAERPVTEEGMREPLVWLASRLEATMRACPAAVLSWSVVAARSARALASRNLLDRNLTAGFVRAWRATDPIVDRLLLAEFLERLERAASGPTALPQEVSR